MATRAPKPSQAQRFTNVNQARLEQGARLSGISAAFGQAADFAPQALALQHALMGGIVRSQSMEAARLALRFGKDDPRVARAAERTQRLQALKGDVDEHTQQLTRFVETFQHDGSFNGYVLQPDGTPATAYTVRVEVTDTTSKRTQRGSGKTDETGYFSIALRGTEGGDTRPGEGLQRLVERLVGELPDDGGAIDDEPPLQRAAAAAAESTIVSRAEVLDASGRVVFEDPVPPSFDVLASEFRYYVLADKAAEATGRGARKAR
jgi:hypothetical protein